MLNMDAQHNDETASEVVITQSDILFECPSCDKSMVIDESATGMVVECPQCQTKVIVPSRPFAAGNAEQQEQVNASLLLAAQQGDVKAANDALARGADISAAASDGTTALMFAVQQGNRDCVQTLIVQGANLEIRRADGQTAVMLAQRAGHFHIVRVLWKADARHRSRLFDPRKRAK